MTLGLVFVPCAGPVLATVTVVAANNSVGLRAILLTLAYAARRSGADAPDRPRRPEAAGALRRHAEAVRMVRRADRRGRVRSRLPLRRPPCDAHAGLYVVPAEQDRGQLDRETRALQGARRRRRRSRRSARPRRAACPTTASHRPCMPAARGSTRKPLTLASLRGKVVLVDFWTYSCINCLRTLPHLKAWYAAYHKEGLVIIGVHTPEFAFEHVTSNVQRGSEATWHHLPGHAGQRLQDLGQLRERVLARRVPDRQTGARSPHPLRRGRVPTDGER